MKMVIYQRESKKERLPLSVSSTAKFALAFALTLGKDYFKGVVLKPT